MKERCLEIITTISPTPLSNQFIQMLYFVEINLYWDHLNKEKEDFRNFGAFFNQKMM